MMSDEDERMAGGVEETRGGKTACPRAGASTHQPPPAGVPDPSHWVAHHAPCTPNPRGSVKLNELDWDEVARRSKFGLMPGSSALSS